MQAPYAPQAISQERVGIGLRLVAVIIDGIIIGIITGILNFIFRGQPVLSSSFGGLIFFLYYIIMEATSGSTLGKKALGLKVVREDGAPISWTESIIRNLLRIIDALPFAYIVGAIIIATSSQKQRLGDKVAHTVVVKTR
ncbi:RDD family protein [Dictyobacter aurantiacus]|uniref:RDD domain-containing protein n=1 Tax=Dictyobacter aurantiacus TaxID=1936993 RepID=A0A401ZP64_9CHLR|nr:RDD family protein [Dictyobacter aurantiacus]GCE08600.1 hypothetical protein KDAU_59290 [Dictyobacter aurantiacus]